MQLKCFSPSFSQNPLQVRDPTLEFLKLHTRMRYELTFMELSLLKEIRINKHNSDMILKNKKSYKDETSKV